VLVLVTANVCVASSHSTPSTFVSNWMSWRTSALVARPSK